jgi:L-lactate dehydrogenase complex protein LldG
VTTASDREHGNREHGDRQAFLSPARLRLGSRDIFVNPVHVPPATPGPDDPVPSPRYLTVDPDDLVGTFVRTVEDTSAHCHVVDGGDTGEIPADLLDRLVGELGGTGAGPADVVVSDEPEATAVGRQLAERGVNVREPTPEHAATARLGVTSAVAGIAATGSLLLDSRRMGSRSACLLPPVHLCVVAVNNLLQTPGDALRGVGSGLDALPSSLVLVTGPSRTGDIEQLITLGAHGPTALHVVLLT